MPNEKILRELVAAVTPAPIISVDPGHISGVALFLPYPYLGGITRYRLFRYGTVNPSTTVSIEGALTRIVATAMMIGPPVLYLEDQYIGVAGHGSGIRLRGASIKALLKSRLTWEILAELLPIRTELVMPSTWQCSTLGVAGSSQRAERKATAQALARDFFHATVTADEADAIMLGVWAVGHQERTTGTMCRAVAECAPKRGERWN